ncbi:hypothetical protein MTBUT4_20178 [Magnetospirillum sp. UT-4]|nr:hypothetical protein MTBUT4_20178 [Magnetospirillum sp. UT-4]
MHELLIRSHAYGRHRIPLASRARPQSLGRRPLRDHCQLLCEY